LGTTTKTKKAIAFAIGIAVALLRASVIVAQESAPAPSEAAKAKDAAAKEHYARIMEHAEGQGRHCMIAGTFKEKTLEALRTFGKEAQFVDLEPSKPIRVTLPEGYYNPAGRTITFDQFELAINRDNLSAPYISMTRTAKGVELEPKIAITIDDGKVICVRYLSAIVNYRSSTGTTQSAPPLH
jgi:hypothetical protein